MAHVARRTGGPTRGRSVALCSSTQQAWHPQGACPLPVLTRPLPEPSAPAAEPRDELFSTFYSSYLPSALYFDSKRSSHPLSIDPGAGPAGRFSV